MSSKIDTAYNRGYLEGREGFYDGGHAIYKHSKIDVYRNAYQRGFSYGLREKAAREKDRREAAEYIQDVEQWIQNAGLQLTTADVFELFRLFKRFDRNEEFLP